MVAPPPPPPPPPPTLAVRRTGAPPPPPFGPGPARRGTLYVTPEIVKNTDVQKNAEELQQGTSAAVIAGRQDDPGEAP